MWVRHHMSLCNDEQVVLCWVMIMMMMRPNHNTRDDTQPPNYHADILIKGVLTYSLIH